MLEVATCPSCGGLIVVGENSTSEGFRMHVNTVDLDNGVFFDADEDLIESEGLSADDGRAKKRRQDIRLSILQNLPSHVCDIILMWKSMSLIMKRIR